MRYEVREVTEESACVGSTGVFRLWDTIDRRWLPTEGGSVFETTHLTGALWVAKTLNKEN